ncbi:Metallo-dependent hydrolase [Lichtheimia hyalospora FSU 10163]|nr:Metallo-dependent hydrolase [Lichtheimia hyalospora FSU 10163]
MAPSTDLVDFCMRLPKVELHAHINGSISPKTMHQLMDRKRAMGTLNEDLAAFQVPDSLERINDFFALFKYIYQLTEDEEAIRITTRNVIDEFAADGVKYLELRTTPRKNPATGMTKESYLAAVLSVVNEPRTDIIVRLIVSIDRRNTLEEAYEAVDLATKFRSQNVVAIDLCGDVSKGSFEALKPAFDKAKSLGFKVTLHFNEIVENMVEAPTLLAFGPDRLGHATFLDDASRQHIYDNDIPVEICMTSNVVSKTVDSYESHHVKDLLKENHPFVLCVS